MFQPLRPVTCLYVYQMRVEDPPAFHLFYATGWRDAVLRVRTLDADGTPQTPGWREVPMFTTPSRAKPLGGAWLSAVVPATGDPARGPPQLAFTVANGGPLIARQKCSTWKSARLHADNVRATWVYCGSAGLLRHRPADFSHNPDCKPTLHLCVVAGDGSAEDRPAPGHTYLCRAPGGFKLLSGRLRPFPRARAASTMLARPSPDHLRGGCYVCGFMPLESGACGPCSCVRAAHPWRGQQPHHGATNERG